MQTPVPQFLYGILGTPLGHSLSPRLHNRAFRLLHHAGAYFAWEKTASELEAFFRAVRSLPISGLSVTLPHKEAVIPFLDGLCPRAERAGAVNTVFWREGRLLGDNTDVGGFLAPLKKRPNLPQAALILGAGGVCRAALAGLRELDIPRIIVAARDPSKARQLAQDFHCSVIPWEERETSALAMRPLLIINATPLGMSGAGQERSPVPENLWATLAAGGKGGDSLAYDLVYSPPRTLFLSQAEARGIPVLNGLDFFVSQAAEQLRLWTGRALPDNMEEEIRQIVESCIH